MIRTARQAIVMAAVMTLFCGLCYPLSVAGLAHLIFPAEASGSLIAHQSHIIGSSLIGQKFSSASYFHGRPSAAGADGYDGTGSGGSNLAPTNKRLIANARARLAAVLAENPGLLPWQVPVDLITASGSGLDPDISPAAAAIQIRRVARARGLSRGIVARLVRKHTRRRWLGVFGERRVNVLMLNLALDELRLGAPHAARR